MAKEIVIGTVERENGEDKDKCKLPWICMQITSRQIGRAFPKKINFPAKPDGDETFSSLGTDWQFMFTKNKKN